MKRFVRAGLIPCLLWLSSVGLSGAEARGAEAMADRALLPEFVGTFSAGGNVVFMLFDGATQMNSPWLKLGQTWRATRLKSFDPQTGQLHVVHLEQESTLALRQGRTTPAAPLSLPGKWRSMELGGEQMGDGLEAVDFQFHADGKFTVVARLKGGNEDAVQGTYRLEENPLVLVMTTSRGTERCPVSLNDGVLTLHDSVLKSYVSFHREP